MEVIIGVVIALSIAVFVILTTSSESGWRRLAETYRSRDSSRSIQWRFVSARMGRGSSTVPYRAALNIGADTAGLHLSLFPLFRLGSPPLFVPWEDLSVSYEDISRREVEFHFRGAPDVILRLGKTIGEDILRQKPS